MWTESGRDIVHCVSSGLLFFIVCLINLAQVVGNMFRLNRYFQWTKQTQKVDILAPNPFLPLCKWFLDWLEGKQRFLLRPSPRLRICDLSLQTLTPWCAGGRRMLVTVFLFWLGLWQFLRWCLHVWSVWSETVETTGEGWKQLPLCQDYKTSAPMTSSGLALPHTQIGVEQPQPLVNNDPLSFGSLDKFPKSAFNVRFTTWGCCKFLYAQNIYYIDV